MKKLKKKGFTFIEVLASVVLLVIVIVPFILYAAENHVVSVKIEQMVKSNLHAEVEMEKIKNILRKSFDTDYTAWSNDLGNNYLASRTSTDASATLKIIGVSVGYDVDNNGSLETDEILVTLKTQYANRS
jgi:prepilin-type N-terminal cleavage/methylation domain-containing protein